jgi:hypothetical protein
MSISVEEKGGGARGVSAALGLVSTRPGGGGIDGVGLGV